MSDLKKKFPWGFPLSDMQVGPYTVRAYHPRKEVDGRVMSDTDSQTTHYHGYIDGKDCNESWLTLDEALAGMIVRRALGPNSSSINEHFIAGISAMSQRA